ncbi:unnamed protein product [Mesocestoides corti]|uniref:SLED domain-containing protein n=1 Tax=Mesocestoides corti TaxID=53468 RepID=A0A0R3U219_MESCO|nr:unnamed protein product [Mesocestoides corti]
MSNETSLLLRWCLPHDLRISQKNCNSEVLFTEFLEHFDLPADQEEASISPFWLSINSATWNFIHPVGWSEISGVRWFPPIASSFSDARPSSPKKQCNLSNRWLQTEWGLSVFRRSVPNLFFENRSICFHNLLRIGGYLECKLTSDPSAVWIHPLGWALSQGYSYRPPDGYVIPEDITVNKEFLDNLPHGIPDLTGKCTDGFLFPNQFSFSQEPPKHSVHVGLKLEAFDNMTPYGASPATVTKIISDRYFVVKIDALPTPDGAETNHTRQFIGHMSMPQIMPPNMSQFYGFHLLPPENWPNDRLFTWHNYLAFMSELSPPQVPCPSSSYQWTDHSKQSLAKHLSTPVHRFFYNHLLKPKAFSESTPDSCIYMRSCDSGSTNARRSNLDLFKLASSKTGTDAGLSTLKDFFVGMKLEMALPSSMWNHISFSESGRIEFHESPLCTATVIRAQAGLLWLLPDLAGDWNSNANPKYPLDKPILFECSSTEIYPLGWSKANGHPFVPPMSYTNPPPLKVDRPPLWSNPAQPMQSSFVASGTLDISGIYSESDICPPIYINSSCYPGPYICQSDLEKLPCQFGPGPIVRNLHTLITRLVGAAFKSVRVLRLLESDWATALANASTSGNSKKRDEALLEAAEQRHEGMQLALIRVRCPRKGTKIEAPVEICCRRRAVEEYCLQVSLLLEACPFLVSTRRIASQESCPINCHCLIRTRQRPHQSNSGAILNSNDPATNLASLTNPDMRLLPRGSGRRVQTVSAQLLDPHVFVPPQLYNWNPTLPVTEDSSEGNGAGQEDAVHTQKTLRTTRAVTSRLKRLLRQRRAALSTNNEVAEVPTLASNPMHWTSADVAAYIERTDCRELWPWLAAEAVDGRAFMLLSPPEILHSLKGLRWDAAVKLARHVVSVKRAFLEQYCSPSTV